MADAPVRRPRRTKQTKNQVILARADVTTASGVVVADWQRLPRQLLREQCQKMKRPAPIAERARSDSANAEYRARIRLPDAKNAAKSMTFCTNESFATFELAQEHAALLALFSLVGPLAYERKLPEPYKTAWLSLSSPNPSVTATSKFASEFDRQAAETERNRSSNRKEAREHFRSKKTVKLALDAEHRQMVERVLENVADRGTSQSSGSLSKDDLDALSERLRSLGFARADVSAAVQVADVTAGSDALASESRAIDWLVTNIPEQRLPKRFAARDDAFRVEVSGDVDVAELPLFDRLRRLGYPRRACQKAANDFNSFEEGKLWLWCEMVRHLCPDLARPDDDIAVEDDVAGELVALEAIYESDFRGGPDSWTVSLSSVFGDGSLLRIDLPSGSRYPLELPVIDVTSSTLSTQERLRLVQEIVRHSASLIGTPFTHDIVEWIRSNGKQALKSVRLAWPDEWLVDRVEETVAKRTHAEKPKRNLEKKLNPDPVLDMQLKREYESRSSSEDYQELLKKRRRLPVFKCRDLILERVMNNRVIVVCAETGSGKSTQIPSMIVENALGHGRGSTCRVVCTQPRRISAVGLATRVATEHCQKVGQLVGYRIRLESKVTHETRLEFVTNGILLRQLMSDPELRGVSHVVLDEVHERSVEIDLLLLILRRLLATRTDLTIVLMSATVNASLLASYFADCPVVNVPGRTFPVEVRYVEDIIEAIGYHPSSRYVKRSGGRQDDASIQTGAEPYSAKTLEVASLLDPDIFNPELLGQALLWIVNTYPSAGGILCFLSGIAEINASINEFRKILDRSGIPSKGFALVPLHGSLSTKDQARVFAKFGSGIRKIVFATNIAETSITVDDVEFVVDSGRMKESQFDAKRDLDLLVDTLVSRANAEQRKGRAGRVKAGLCLRLYRRAAFNAMPNQHRPELHRTSLDQVCLQLKAANIPCNNLGELLKEALEPPPVSSIRRAVSTLQTIGALTAEDEELTPLGRHLAVLPMDVRLGKMLIFAACFDCVSPILVIASFLSLRSPFIAPSDQRDAAQAARKQFAGGSISDHMALLNMFTAWLDVRQSGECAERDFCDENFVSRMTVSTAFDLCKQFVESLRSAGFIQRSSKNTSKSTNLTSVFGLAEHHDRNASNVSVITAIICAGLYPNVLRVQHPETRFAQVSTGALPKTHNPKSIRFFRKDGERVFIHPSSVCFSVNHFQSPWIVYNEQRQTSKLFVYDASMVPSYALLLFGGKVDVSHERSTIIVDGWIEFKAPARIAVLVRGLRQELDALFLAKANDPSVDIACHQVSQAMLALITTSGSAS